ncbi:MAG: hypothetical protein IPI62_07955 [Bacteroidetes bacterium]|nr:hypothetical protein [Bacteroidota bacterium]
MANKRLGETGEQILGLPEVGQLKRCCSQLLASDGELANSPGGENSDPHPWIMSKTSTFTDARCHQLDSSFGWRFIKPKMKEQFVVDAI